MKVCSVDGCTKLVEAKGLCRSHYDRNRKYGDPLNGSTYHGEPMKFVSDVLANSVGTDCILWPFGKSGTGYGVITVRGKKVIASRYVCEAIHGPPPTPEHHAAHSCGKGHEGCVTPQHLRWATKIDNEHDKIVHGTHNRGERCGTAELTEAEAIEIRSLKGREHQSSLAKRFGVSQSTVSRIQNGKLWKHAERRNLL